MERDLMDWIETLGFPPTTRDLQIVNDFQRFLRAVRLPPPKLVSRDGRTAKFAVSMKIRAGWLPYAWGLGPAPPPDLEGIAVTAWTLPA